jgi:hypothetical protein
MLSCTNAIDLDATSAQRGSINYRFTRLTIVVFNNLTDVVNTRRRPLRSQHPQLLLTTAAITITTTKKTSAAAVRAMKNSGRTKNFAWQSKAKYRRS